MMNKEFDEQLTLIEQCQNKANVTIVTCGNCGSVFLHFFDEHLIKCPHCKLILDNGDCPDLFCEKTLDNDKKYMFITIHEVNGDQEYTQPITCVVDKDADLKEKAIETLKEFYVDIGAKYDEEEQLIEFYNGGIVCTLENFKEISEVEYNILKKYNI